MSEESLTIWRDKINKIDSQILDLLHERALCSQKIGEIKSQNQQEVYCPAREDQVISRMLEKNKTLRPETVQKLYALIMEESRYLQKR